MEKISWLFIPSNHLTHNATRLYFLYLIVHSVSKYTAKWIKLLEATNIRTWNYQKYLWYPELGEAMHIYILIKKPTKSLLLNFRAHLNLLYLFLLFSFKHPHNLQYYGSVFFLIYQMSMLAYKLKYDSEQNL